MKQLINKKVELRIDNEDDDYISIPCKIVGYHLETYHFEESWNETMSFLLNLEPLDFSVMETENLDSNVFTDVPLSDLYKL